MAKTKRFETAVEWLVKELKIEGHEKLIKRALAIEKEQIRGAFVQGDEFRWIHDMMDDEDFEYTEYTLEREAMNHYYYNFVMPVEPDDDCETPAKLEEKYKPIKRKLKLP
jgi:hypothetical protein